MSACPKCGSSSHYADFHDERLSDKEYHKPLNFVPQEVVVKVEYVNDKDEKVKIELPFYSSQVNVLEAAQKFVEGVQSGRYSIEVKTWRQSL